MDYNRLLNTYYCYHKDLNIKGYLNMTHLNIQIMNLSFTVCRTVCCTEGDGAEELSEHKR